MVSRADIVVEDFGNTLGIKGMKFDDNQMCSFKVNNTFDITLLASNQENMFIYGIIGKVPAEYRDEVSTLMLTTNLFLAESGWPTLAYEPNTRSLLLAKAYPLDELDAFSLESIVSLLAEKIEHIENTLKAQMDITLLPVS